MMEIKCNTEIKIRSLYKKYCINLFSNENNKNNKSHNKILYKRVKKIHCGMKNKVRPFVIWTVHFKILDERE